MRPHKSFYFIPVRFGGGLGRQNKPGRSISSRQTKQGRSNILARVQRGESPAPAAPALLATLGEGPGPRQESQSGAYPDYRWHSLLASTPRPQGSLTRAAQPQVSLAPNPASSGPHSLPPPAKDPVLAEDRNSAPIQAIAAMTAGYRYPILHTHTHTRYVPAHTDPQKLYPAIFVFFCFCFFDP